MEERVGIGRTAEVLAHGEGRVLKLFLPGFAQGLIHEYEISSRVDALDVGAPRVYGMAEKDGRRGIVYARVQGESMLALLERNPMAIRRMAKLLASVQHRISGGSGQGLPSLRTRLAGKIRAQQALAPALREAVLARLGALADGERLCHGDLHPGNVLVAGEGGVAIDWVDACCGHPAADICRSFLIVTLLPPPQDAAPTVQRALRAFSESFGRQYLAEAMRLAGYGQEIIGGWMSPVAAARLAESVPGEAEALCEVVRAYLG